jgi:hypothetical protein
MISSPLGHAPSPPVNRRFEFTRLHGQIIASAYEALVPIVARRPGAEDKRPQGHPKDATRSPLPRTSGTGA